MENKAFILRHKNEDVALLQISENGDIHDAKILQSLYVPFVATNDERAIYRWWNDRAIPEGRERLSELLRKYGCKRASELLLKNLGLSLTDAYWVCPFDYRELTWEDVNLFEHGDDSQHFHESNGRAHYSTSPNAALGGSLDKESVRLEDGWYLDKSFDKRYPDAQQNVNELFISEMHRRQGWNEYTPYSVITDNNGKCIISRCRYFTDQNLELISAYDITGGYSSEELSGIDEINKFVEKCVDGGLDKEYVRRFLDYMIAMDYVTSNSDRHWHNFGVLRDTDSLKLQSMAPIYDNGNAMFYDSPYALTRTDIIRMENTGIEKREIDRLKIIKDKSLVNADLLPSPEEVKEFYVAHGLKEIRASQISQSYSCKLKLFLEFKHGIEINFATDVDS